MSTKKITQLQTATDITASDLLQVVDVEDEIMAASGTNKRITAQTLGNFLPVTATGSSASRSLKDRFADTVCMEDFGADGTSSSSVNAAAFIACIQSGKRVVTPQRAYTFQFDGTPIVFTGAVLDLDLGPYKHTFLNFGGITANTVSALRYNGRFTANNGYCKGLGRFRNLQSVEIDTIEITDVFCDTPSSATQFFGLEYSSNLYGDNPLVINVNNAVFKNIITKTPDYPNAVPMTGFGNFGSSSSQVKRHLLRFGNLHVEEFYTVSPSDGVTVIGGDSDFFRLFTNPTMLTVDNCYITNVGKRFIKTQEETYVTVNNLTTILDNRFTTSNYNGTFEGQASNSTVPTRFVIQAGNIDYTASNTPVFFNANGLPHEMYLSNVKFANLVGYSTEACVFYMQNCTGTGFNASIPLSNRCVIDNCIITDFRGLSAEENKFKNCSLTLADDVVSSIFMAGGSSVTMEDVKLLNWDTNVKVCKFESLENVYLDRTRGSAMRRPFQPVDAKTCTFKNVKIVQSGGVDTNSSAIESIGAGSTGEIICRDYRSTMPLAFFSTGTWSFVLDNCVSNSVTGSGVSSVKTATYV